MQCQSFFFLSLLPALACGCGASTTEASSSDTGAALSDTGSSALDTGADTNVTIDSVAAETAAEASVDADADAIDGDAAVVCSTLALGPAVTVNAVAEAAPALKGGVITDGTYVMTMATDYTGTGGATGPRAPFQRTTRFTGSGTAFETVRKDKDAALESYSGSLAIIGGVLQQTQTCPTVKKVSIGSNTYEATPTTFKIYVASDDGVSPRLVVMTKM